MPHSHYKDEPTRSPRSSTASARVIVVGPIRQPTTAATRPASEWYHHHPQSSSYPEQQRPLLATVNLTQNFQTFSSSPSIMDPTPNPILGPPAAFIHPHTPTDLSPVNSLRTGRDTAVSSIASHVPHDLDESQSEVNGNGGVGVNVRGKVESDTKQKTDGSKQVHVGDGDQSATNCCNQMNCCTIM